MKKNLLTFLLISILCNIPIIANAVPKPLLINKALLQKLVSLKTSREIKAILGEPCCCVPFGKPLQKTTICQWKPETKSNSIINTLNIIYEVDQVREIRAVTAQGTVLVVQNGKVKVDNS